MLLFLRRLHNENLLSGVVIEHNDTFSMQGFEVCSCREFWDALYGIRLHFDGVEKLRLIGCYTRALNLSGSDWVPFELSVLIGSYNKLHMQALEAVVLAAPLAAQR